MHFKYNNNIVVLHFKYNNKIEIQIWYEASKYSAGVRFLIVKNNKKV